MTSGRTGEMTSGDDLRQWRNKGLALLAHPEPGKTTGDLLTRMMLDNDLAGNCYVVRRPDTLKVLRPDWTEIVIGSTKEPITGTFDDLMAWDVDAGFAGIIHQPGGPSAGQKPVAYLAEEVAHFALTPDPLARYRGISWLQSCLREMMADTATTTLKQSYFEHGATPNLLVQLPVADPAKFREWTAVFDQEHEGAERAWKTMYLGQGHDATVIGNNLGAAGADLKALQGSGETRLAAAAGVPPVIAGISEGLQGSSLNAGNFGAARRMFADMTIRPAWRNACGSLESIIPPPQGFRLWYDATDIPFLAEDVKDAADVLALQATAMRTLGDGGWDPDSVVDAVASGDLYRLYRNHTGLLPVQLQAPGTSQPSPETMPESDGAPTGGPE